MAKKKEKEHTKYFDKDGNQVPSCTTVLGVLSAEELMHWSNYLGLKGQKYKEVLDGYARIGTLVHAYIEDYLVTLPDEEFNEKFDACSALEVVKAKNAFNGFIDWIERQDFELMHSEVQCVSEELKFGGTVDCVALLDDMLTIIDFKTSKNFNIKHFLQLSGYVQLLKEKGIEIEQVMILRLGRDDSSFETKVMKTSELEPYFNLFKLCIQVYNARKLVEEAWKL